MSFLESVLPVFYRSAEQPENWLHALDLIKQEMQVGSVVIQKMKQKNDRLHQEWIVRDSETTEQAEAHDCLVNNDDNPRLDLKDLTEPLPELMVYRAEDDITEKNRQEFKGLQQRQQLLGLGQPIILGVKYSDDSSLCMLMHRYADDAREFTDDHVTFLQALTPHLKQTISLSEKLGQLQEQTNTLTHCLDQFNSGMLVLNSRGELSWANSCARQILKRSRHVFLSGAKLRCTTKHDQQRLEELIASASDSNQPGKRFVGAIGTTWDYPLQLLAVPVYPTLTHSSGKLGKSPYIALYLSELETQANISAPEVMHLFGLTPAEARLAIALCDGVSLNEYALNQGTAVGTARIQLKSVFSKLGINRQPDLVRLIGSSIAAKTLHQNN